MGVRRPPALLVGLWMVVAVIAGCTSSKSHAAGGIPCLGCGSQKVTGPPECPTADDVHLPKNFGPVSAAYVCRIERRTVDGEGKWEFLVVRKVTGGLDHLLDVYATKDAKPTDGMCLMVLFDPRVVWLHGSKTLAVRAPQDGCQQPTSEGMAAFDALTFTTVSATKVRQVESELAQGSGCGETYKDELAIQAADGYPKERAAKPVKVGPATVRVCQYELKGAQSQTPDGHLIGIKHLSHAEVAALDKALARARVDASCDEGAGTRFAVIRGHKSTTLRVPGRLRCPAERRLVAGRRRRPRHRLLS